MSFKDLKDSYSNIGVKQNFLPWEIHLTRKLNIISLIGFVNVASAFVILEVLGYTDFRLETLFVLLAAPFVVIFNVKKNYIWAAYLFNIIGYVYFTTLNLKMGLDSLMFLFYFPMIISAVQLLARKETIVHMVVVLFLCLTSICVVIYGFKHQWLYIPRDSRDIEVFSTISLFFSFFVTIVFIVAITLESINQERIIKNMLTEKEVLLAEVFHRVKNNMNIVTSLLNLKKNASDSREVKDALEECRNRVYSMALVHQNIYNTKNLTNLDLKEYLHDLIDELLNSHGNSNNVEVVINCDEIFLELTHAVPFGLVLNELVTNSFKYAQVPGKKLRIEVDVKHEAGQVRIKVKDNGSGIPDLNLKTNTLGMDLITSLSEQLDGVYSFKNDNGLLFELSFKG
jgi:two-component sensor histidine kinase